jgi:hypothetical protein
VTTWQRIALSERRGSVPEGGSRCERFLIRKLRAVIALAGDKAAKIVTPSLEAALELARQTATASSRGKRPPVITSVRVSVDGGSKGQGGGPVTVFNERGPPVNAGPTRRPPIHAGGGTCWTIPTPWGKLTICIDWES